MLSQIYFKARMLHSKRSVFNRGRSADIKSKIISSVMLKVMSLHHYLTTLQLQFPDDAARSCILYLANPNMVSEVVKSPQHTGFASISLCSYVKYTVCREFILMISVQDNQSFLLREYSNVILTNDSPQLFNYFLCLHSNAKHADVVITLKAM